MNRETILGQLARPLDPSRVAKRSGAGSRKLSYLESYDVIDHLNLIFGYDGWSDRVQEIAQVNEHVWRATVELIVEIGDRTVIHTDTGIGICKGASTEEQEKAVKECVSDALKRAARKLGDQFGNCLYDKEAPEHNGRNAPPAPQQPREQTGIRQGDNGGGVPKFAVVPFGADKGRPFRDLNIHDLNYWRRVTAEGLDPQSKYYKAEFLDFTQKRLDYIEQLLLDRDPPPNRYHEDDDEPHPLDDVATNFEEAA